MVALKEQLAVLSDDELEELKQARIEGSGSVPFHLGADISREFTDKCIYF